MVIHDAPYAALTYDGLKPLSFLSVPGAKDVGVELHSLSKSYNMTGWRIGFVAGNPLVVKAFSDVKDNNDSGQFIAIQKAAAYGLAHPEITEAIADKYSRRHNLLVDALNSLGFKAEKPKAPSSCMSLHLRESKTAVALNPVKISPNSSFVRS